MFGCFPGDPRGQVLLKGLGFAEAVVCRGILTGEEVAG